MGLKKLADRLAAMDDEERRRIIEDKNGMAENFSEADDQAVGRMIEIQLRCGHVRHYLRTKECEAAATASFHLSQRLIPLLPV